MNSLLFVYALVFGVWRGTRLADGTVQFVRPLSILGRW
jgi:hypothetical protein